MIRNETVTARAREHAKPFLLFALVGAFGTLLNTAVLWSLTTLGNWHYLLASVVATEAAIISNFLGNNYLTFRGREQGSKWSTFARFQAISLVTVIGTLLILWGLTTKFGTGANNALLLMWNLIAIGAMFLANYALNHRLTWGAATKTHAPAHTAKSGRRSRDLKAFGFLLLALLLGIMTAHAALGDSVAVSQLGYHPQSHKQAIVYTSDTSGTFEVHNTSDDAVAFSGDLVKAKDSNGNDVECQGNLPCLIGDFTNLTAQGTYYVAVNGLQSPAFPIDSGVFADNIGLFSEFFDATKQQDSSYHANLHDSTFPYMADGSFIMESYQASFTLIRLGNAYRRNPSLFDSNMRETIRGYVTYLESLQGVVVTNDPNGVRRDPGMQISNVFYPGPVPDGITDMDVYNPGENHTIAQANVPVTSLCGEDDGSDAWDTCIADAEQYDKCQIDEPCLNLTYVGQRSAISHDGGFGVSRGWYYEFGCYNDVVMNQSEFTDGIDPCQVFYPEANRQNTVQALLAFTQSIPAINDVSPSEGEALYQRSVDTYGYVKSHYGTSFAANDPDAGFWGAALFLLYEYSDDESYLQEAVALGQDGSVSPFFDSSDTEGNAYYWEEYALHRTDIENANLTYLIDGDDPALYFRGSMYQEWNGQGNISIDQSGERVFQVYRNSGFQNSREMLSVAVLAAKATDLNTNSEPFIPLIADSQIAWLTGANLVQDGVSANPPTRSYSFIFGIGDQPSEFHSRYLVTTGYLGESNGEVLGARGTGYQFQDGSDYEYFDGSASILGKRYGAFGNGWHGEDKIDSPFVVGQAFSNGQTYIPGWINGAFDTVPDNGGDNDVIYNYRDNMNTYEFTETTNEMVGTAVELFAYLDARMNNRSRHAPVTFGGPAPEQNGTLLVTTHPSGADVYVNSSFVGNTTPSGLSIDEPAGDYELLLFLSGYEAQHVNASVVPSNTTTIDVTLTPISTDPHITGNATDLSGDLPENSTATFTVTLDQPVTVQWYVNETLVETDTGASASYAFSPNIFNTSDSTATTVTAVTPAGNVSWPVTVINRVNPFFQGELGIADPTIHVLTNNALRIYQHANVTILGEDGVSHVVELDTLSPVNATETNWEKAYNATVGNNNMTRIVLRDDVNDVTEVYDLTGTERVHYRAPADTTVPGSSPGSHPGGGRGGSGGGGIALDGEPIAPELVYVIFGKDTLKVGDTQTLKLDARIEFGARITGASARLLRPDGEVDTITLALTSGTDTYGTWSADIGDLELGKYILTSVTLESTSESQKTNIKDRSFYVGDGSAAPAPFGVVYTTLSADNARAGDEITLRIDATDTDGIASAIAHINAQKGDAFDVLMRLVSGTNVYGTWEGAFAVTNGDATYAVTSITLARANGQAKDVAVQDRSVYVAPAPGGNLLTGNAVDEGTPKGLLDRIVKQPLLPSLLAFGLMALIVSGVYLRERLRERRKGVLGQG